MLAANYLDIKGLLNLTRQMVKGKMPEEVCEVKIQKKLSTSSTPALTTTMSSKRKDMEARFQIYLAKKQETAMEMLTGFAVNGEERRKLGRRPEQPPLQIVNYPELFDIAWGWDSILPYFPVHPWCLYMTYLQEYYKRNSPEVSAHQLEANAATGPDLNGDDGNDLTTLFNSCISLEDQLLNMLSRCDKKHNVDEISLKDKFTNFAHQTTIVEYAGFMTTSVALKCVMAETYLLFELLKTKTGMVHEVNLCSMIRKTAFGFMTYEGPQCVEAAATMMAITKEAKLMRELLRELLENKSKEINRPLSWSAFIRDRTCSAMLRIWRECSPVKESTGGNTASKSISDESGDKNPSEKELGNKDNLLQGDKMNENTKICSEEELPKENHLDKRNEADCYDKTGSEMGIVGGNIGEMNVAKQTIKLEDSLKTSSGFDEKDQGKRHTRVSRKGRWQCRTLKPSRASKPWQRKEEDKKK